MNHKRAIGRLKDPIHQLDAATLGRVHLALKIRESELLETKRAPNELRRLTQRLETVESEMAKRRLAGGTDA